MGKFGGPILALGAVAALSAPLSVAMAAPAPKILEARERLGPRKISANEPVVGVVLGSPLAKIDQPVLYVEGLKSSDRTLCINIERVDGAYALDMTVDVTGAVARTAVTLPFRDRSPNFREIRGLPAIQVAVLARVSSAAGGCRSDAPFAPTAWQAGVTQPTSLLLLSRNATATLSGPKLASQDCRGLLHVAPIQGQLTSFDTACTVQKLPCAATSAVSIRREEDDGGRLPLIQASIRAAC